MSVIVLTSEVGYKETAWQKEVQLLVKMVTVTQRSGLFLFFFFFHQQLWKMYLIISHYESEQV